MDIYQVMEECASGQRNIRCHASSAESVEEAHRLGMSVGKYRAYLILLELDPDITPEEVQEMTMRELYQLIQSYTQEDGASVSIPEHTGGGYGGHGHGYGSHRWTE